MTTEQFLNLLEEKGLLSNRVVVSLRNRMASSPNAASVKAVARFLVEKGQLTSSQVDQLLAEPTPDGDGQASNLTLGSKKITPPSAEDQGALFEEPLPEGEGSETEVFTSLAPISKRGWLAFFGRRFGTSTKQGYRKQGSDKQGPHSEWDSPLLLVGGGVLILFVLIGGTVLYLLNRGGGDEQLKLADADYDSAAYTQAIDKYQKYLNDYPAHPRVGWARVRCGLAQMRKASEQSSKAQYALKVINRVLLQIENEPEFVEVRSETALILPDLAAVLARQAEENIHDPVVAEQYVERTKETLALVMNTKYVPKSLRNNQRISRIRETLASVVHELKRDAELQRALEVMQGQIDMGQTTEAYAVRKGLLSSYPELSGHPRLRQMVINIAQAERGQVVAASSQNPAFKSERDSPMVAELALAHHQGGSQGNADGQVVCIRTRHAVYGLDASTGRLLWRRSVGFDGPDTPWPLPSDDGGDLVVWDSNNDELVRVDVRGGKLIWRHPVGDLAARPVWFGDRILVATREGKLIVLEESSGNAVREVTFPQSLSVASTVHPKQPVIYQIGDHSTLYVLAADDFSCQEVLYLGHRAGTVEVSPVVALGYLVVAENFGESSSRIHILAIDETGKGLKPVQKIRLDGLVLTEPIVSGRKLIVGTDRGQIKVFEVGSAVAGSPLTLLAERAVTDDKRRISHLLLNEGNLWAADDQLTKYKLQISSGRLAPEAIGQSYQHDVFDQPLQRFGDVLVHARRPPGVAGLVVSGMDVHTGKPLWETELAVVPAGSPLVDSRRRTISLVGSSGALFQFDPQAIRQRVQDQPQAVPTPRTGVPLLVRQINLENGRAVFAADGGQSQVLVYLPDDKLRPVSWHNLPVESTALPSGWGEGLILPTKMGQVFWVDPASGQPLAQPFQPQLDLHKPLNWGTPCTFDAESKQFVISTGRGKLYRVGLDPQPSPHLKKLAESEDLVIPISSPLAVLGSTVYGVDGNRRLLSFNLKDLKLLGTVNLGAPPTWGPCRVGDGVFLTTEADELFCLDGAQNVIWKKPLNDGPLAGLPLAVDGGYVMCSTRGVITRLAAETGEEQKRIDLKTTLATGAVPFAGRLIVAGPDATLLVINML